ncbi:hypothetical protein EI555_015700 [Monodon monoceros]|uniref:Transmembrane protein 236 n=1 Tax=Monodon monoceros TaxID=40151 RepID=A0A4U1ENB6_MONMO|nr:hypothetical protein EI555_015700 [Monodon monoceros]
MASRRLMKLLFFELLELAAFSVPTLVIMEQFADAYQSTRGTPGKTHYWLIVSCSIAYVSSVTLLIWVPVKLLLYRKRHLYQKIKGCICTVWLLYGKDFAFEMGNEDRHIHTTSLPQIKTVTDELRQNEENLTPSQPAKRTQLSWLPGATTGGSTPELEGPQEPTFEQGILRMMSQQDVRAEIFLWSFLLWSDTIEMVRVAGHPNVYKSGWVYPVYIFSFISLLRMILTPRNPLLNSLGIVLQDLPFIFVRLSLIIGLGTITPILGLCKNVLVTLSYVYFNYLTKFRIFSL